MMQIPALFIGNSAENGRGVFAAKGAHAGDLIEICPVVVISSGELPHIDKTTLFEYYFLWEKGKGNACIPLGFGSLYNHSQLPNAEVEMDIPQRLMYVKCIYDIAAGGEVLIDYLAGNTDQTSLWFDTDAPENGS
jgi:SET domain-containing protein